jgi:hypothetical protein
MDDLNNVPLDQNEILRTVISKKGWLWFTVILTILGGTAAAISLLNAGSYGVTLFCAIPFTVGFVIGFLYAPTRKAIAWKTMLYALGIICLLGLLIMALGSEGGICFLMAAGLLFLPALLGVSFGHFLGNSHLKTEKIYILFVFIMVNPSALTYDILDHSQVAATSATEVIINASDSTIWHKLTQKVEFNKSNNFFLKSGISYPLDMELQKVDNQCFLKCNTTNGFANLRVDSLIQNKKMVFKPMQEVPPMRETALWGEIDAPHLHGYFKNEYGLFEIVPLEAGKCRLIAQTHYTYRITPVWYWSWWSDYLVNQMHKNVLNKIKEAAEVSTE